jgi:hypothetical protein
MFELKDTSIHKDFVVPKTISGRELALAGSAWYRPASQLRLQAPAVERTATRELVVTSASFLRVRCITHTLPLKVKV